MLCPINSWCRSNHRSNCFTPLHFTALINTETGDARTALTTFRFCCRLGRANPLRDWWLPAAAAIGNRVTPLRQRTPGHLAPSDPKRFARSRVSAMGMRGVTSGIVRLVGLQEWRLQTAVRHVSVNWRLAAGQGLWPHSQLMTSRFRRGAQVQCL